MKDYFILTDWTAYLSAVELLPLPSPLEGTEQWDQEPWTLVYGSELYCEVPRTVHYVADSCGTKVGFGEAPNLEAPNPVSILIFSGELMNYSNKLQSLMSFSMC